LISVKLINAPLKYWGCLWGQGLRGKRLYSKLRFRFVILLFGTVWHKLISEQPSDVTNRAQYVFMACLNETKTHKHNTGTSFDAVSTVLLYTESQCVRSHRHLGMIHNKSWAEYLDSVELNIAKTLRMSRIKRHNSYIYLILPHIIYIKRGQ
jgi:phenylalanine-4-hydroxylase